MKEVASEAVAPFHGPATEINTTFCLPYCEYKSANTEAIAWQWGHHGSINSRNTTFPLNDERVNVCPVKPFCGLLAQDEVEAHTTGRVKSGAKPDWDMVVLTELLIELDPPGEVCVNEYMDQIATMIMIGMAIFSHLLKP